MTAAPLDLAVLGATGSVGGSTLDVAARHPGRYRIFALSAHTAVQPLLELCQRYKPRYAVLSGTAPDEALARRFALAGCELLFGAAGLERIASDPQCRVVMAAIVGAAGLPATLAAARAGKRILLANKEALVMAGHLFMRTARQAGAELLPIDSEHNAVFQCLSGNSRQDVRRIVLTASGGPFRSVPAEKLAAVTPAQACAHPNWVMGPKISVDSATMMNKGLEVIEARWLFDLPPERIEIVVHPQSIVHSLVEYVDGSIIAQMSNPDMRVPIAHALGFPERIDSGARALDLGAIGQLSFERADVARFPCVRLAYEALNAGGTAPAILNAANESAVEAFLAGRLAFTGIARVIEQTLAEVGASSAEDLATILSADADARRAAQARIETLMGRAA
jgi:1-deoxy-D-xylulose-5-phosphate reductoisomerase